MLKIPSPIDWNTVLMQMAYVVAQRSKDPSAKVGCVVVSPDRRQISFGYNGFPAKDVPDYVEWWHRRTVDEDTDDFCKYDLVNHAEVNAMFQARTDLTNWSLYCTVYPCLNCMRLIVTSGIKHVYYSEYAPTVLNLQQSKGAKLLKLAGVTLEQIKIDEINIPVEHKKNH